MRECGVVDLADFDAVYAIDVQGILAVSGTPTPDNKFFEGTVLVAVMDGFLTVSNDPGATNNKIDFIDIAQVAPVGRVVALPELEEPLARPAERPFGALPPAEAGQDPPLGPTKLHPVDRRVRDLPA